MRQLAASPQEQHLLAGYIIDQVIGRASGRLSLECEKNNPRDVYFIGSIRSQDGNVPQPGAAPHIPELLNKLAPVAFGADFRLVPQTGTAVYVVLRWASYYRIFPTLAQQLEHQRGPTRQGPNHLAQDIRPAGPVGEEVGEEPDPEQDEEEADDGDDDGDGAEDANNDDGAVDEAAVGDGLRGTPNGPAPGPGGNARRTDTMMPRYRKIDCQAEGEIIFRRADSGAWLFDLAAFEQAVIAEIARARNLVAQDPDALRSTPDIFAQIRVPDQALESQNLYNAFLAGLRTPVVPDWQWQVRCEAPVDVHDPSCVVFSIVFANNTSRQLAPNGKDHPHIESYFFDTSARFEFRHCDVLPFIINLAPQGFRYDRHIPSRGFNCAVRRVNANVFDTTHVPVFEQLRYETRSQPAAAFADLANQPVPVLDAILASMEAYCTEWENARRDFENSAPDWHDIHGAEFDRDFETFEDEIERFRRGRDLIRDNADVRLAFQLTNETFRRGPRQQWRLFQIVFLVSQIPGIASLGNVAGSDPAELDRADVIYFPTGGGKTEAYLAALVFHCFFDRLRGKTAGMTAWIRFPLRLLTLQQTQRVADAICVAELVRREQADRRLSDRNVAGFAVGYFVGKTSTPNEIINADTYQYAGPDDIATWRIANDANARQRWKRLIVCPSCQTPTVTVELDTARVRLIHRCTRETCAFPDGQIPVYVIDNEIYRYLPAVLVGTIDKLASVGNQRKMALLFGTVDGYCSTHGYYKGRCCQRECDNRNLVPRIPSGLSGPTLFLQDELHLLKEGLGTFDSHYETFVQELLRATSPNARIKIIASSATIENFRRQIEHLYAADRDLARIFPGPGPVLGRSFYAETRDYPQRLYVGLIPHNKTIFNAMLELLELYHTIIQELMGMGTGTANPYGGAIAPATAQWFDLLDRYVTSLSYFLKGRDLNSLHTDLDGHVTPLLQAAGLNPLEIRELTGSTTTDEVARTLEMLQTPKPQRERATAILATSMVSHGVDIDRLNGMFFYGMPRQNAEYIQASSRVGRTNLGIVFVCHHPARERDQSHYSFFSKFHEYLGQLVEPVAINRWAKFSINRTLPGLFMGVLLQLIANQTGGKNVNRFVRIEHVRQLITSGAITTQNFIPFLEEAYRVGRAQGVAEETFRDEIHLRVRQFFDQILQAGPARQWVSDALIPRPMSSLRDVDEPIPISLDQDGTLWASRTSV